MSQHVKLTDLIQHHAQALAEERNAATSRGLDAPIHTGGGHKVASAGTLHLYRFEMPASAALAEDIPVTVIVPGDQEPIEGFVVGRDDGATLIQTFEAFGQAVESASIVPDTSAFYDTAATRLAAIAAKADTYALGPAERLVPWLSSASSRAEQLARGPIATAAFTTLWSEEPAARGATLATLAIDLARSNKRTLLISPNHRRSDDLLGTIARTMKAAGLPFKSLLCRYEMPIRAEANGIALSELGFEAQMHQFYARSRADKAALRRKYERFRELTPLLAYKAQKQRDLDEVKLLEWRLLTQLSDLQRKIKEITATLAVYESLPIWKRLAMQAAGKNVASLGEYKTIYEGQVQGLLRELEIAKRRIDELSPEAAIPKDLRPEYDELKEDIKKLGGTKQIREMLAAEEDTNRQAFVQNKRIVATTAARVIADPLFGKVRFDVLIVDEAPQIQAAFLLAAASLARERIVLSGAPTAVAAAQAWAEAESSLRQRI